MCRSIENFVQTYPAMTNRIKRSFTQMAEVSFIPVPESQGGLKIEPANALRNREKQGGNEWIGYLI